MTCSPRDEREMTCSPRLPPELCARCNGRDYRIEMNDIVYKCGLMVEAHQAGLKVWSCAHFR